MASGGVNSWPDYMQYAQCLLFSGADADSFDGAGTWRNGSFFLEQDLNSARSSNPYSGAAAFDPTLILADIQTKDEEFEDAVGSLSPEGNFEDFLQTSRRELSSVDIIEADDVTDLDIDDEIDQQARAVENRITPEMLRSAGRLAVSYHQANGLRSTGFVFGLADLERAQADKVTDFRDKARGDALAIKLQYQAQGGLAKQKADFEGKALDYRAQTQYALAGAVELLRQNLSKVTLTGDIVARRLDVGKTKIVAFKEQNDMGVMLDVKESTWDLDLYAYFGNFLASVSGSTYRTAGEASWWEKAISTALGAASLAPQIKSGLDWVKGLGDDDKWLG